MLWRISWGLWIFCMVVAILGGWVLWPFIILGVGFQFIALWELAQIEHYKNKLPWKDTTKWTRNT